MKKLIISLILILSSLFVGSCSLGGLKTDLFNNNSEEETAKARKEAIFEALKNKDKDALKAIFSQKAISDAEDLDAKLDNLFIFIQGELVSWEEITGLGVDESNDHGHVTKKVRTYFYINTDEQKYYIYLEDFPVDTDHPENVGLYLLLIVKAEDEDKVWDGEQKIMYDDRTRIPRDGIYIPFE